MVDMNNPAPWIMTHYERTAFIGAVLAVVATMAWDWMRRAKRAGAPPKL